MVFDGFTKEVCIAGYLFAANVYRLRRKSGLLFTALYLKQCSSSLQKAFAGDPNSGLLPVPVSLTRSGYPRLIPRFHRQMIMRRDDKDGSTVWFSLYKVILLCKRIPKDSFDSIVKPVENQETIDSLVG